jgi:hypothetical protein
LISLYFNETATGNHYNYLLGINHSVSSKLRTVDEIAGVKKSVFLLKLDIFLLKLDKRGDFIWILEKIDHLKK